MVGKDGAREKGLEKSGGRRSQGNASANAGMRGTALGGALEIATSSGLQKLGGHRQDHRDIPTARSS